MILITGLFSDSQKAGEMAGELKQRGFVDRISVVARDETSGEARAHDVKTKTGEAMAAGGFLGAVAGVTAVAIAGVGSFLIGGPLAAALGAVGGAMAGGLAEGMRKMGIPEEIADEYAQRLGLGEVLVAVEAEEEKEEETINKFVEMGGQDIVSFERM